MPKLIIDDQEIEVASGTKVIEAAEQLGIMIPRFCYHKALGSVGACRMCAVKCIEGPYKGLQMSCMMDAKDGMVVSTTDPEAVEFRQYVIEWLMINHPHDCPVCDEGGHCLLQDTTVSGGHGLRRYAGEKRTYRDQNLGHLVAHEMNRCIHCYRCVRFYREYSGYRDLGTMGIASRTYFGRFADGPLESPFSGNLVDICPTGVYTDKPSRYRVRRWDLQRCASVCIHCSLGCNTIAGARYHEVLRNEARQNDAINGFFICDRGRYGYAYESHPDRPREAMISGSPVSVDEAIDASAEAIGEIISKNGPNAVACLGSSRNSLETQAMISRLCQDNGLLAPMFFTDNTVAEKVRAAVNRTDARIGVSLSEIEEADFILALGADPINEAPMLALSMRQASRNGACVAVADPRPVTLPLEFEHFPVHADHLKNFLHALIHNALSDDDIESLSPEAKAFYQTLEKKFPPVSGMEKVPLKIREKLKSSRKPVLICGTHVADLSMMDAAADAALLLSEIKEKAGVFFLYPGANSFGAALFDGSNSRSFMDVMREIETGKVKALVVVESNPFFLFPDRQRFVRAIKKLELFLVLDYIPSPTMRRAGIFIPTGTIFEAGGSFINQEGRIQYARPVLQAGTPIRQVNEGSHPPRVFAQKTPGSSPAGACEVIARLSETISGNKIPAENFAALISGQGRAGSFFKDMDYPADNVRIIPVKSDIPAFSSDMPSTLEVRPANELQLLMVEWTFGTEVLSAFSKPVCEVESFPFICMHPEDAALAQIEKADRIILSMSGGPLEVRLVLNENMARGTLVLPRHRQLEWQKFESFGQGVIIGLIEPA